MAHSTPIYMDNHATTRTDPRVVEAMLPYFSEVYGNPGSVGHEYGAEAHTAVELATASLAAQLGADPQEIIFTSGATESNNLAIRGLAERNQRRGKHLVSVRTEHRAVLDPLERLVQQGYEVTLLEVERHGSTRAGWLDPEQVAEAIQDDTILVSVMLANNEIGVIQPLAEIAAVCRHSGVLLHCDATQAVGKIPVSVRELGVDLMSFSGHKIYGPKGIGALYVRRGSPIVRFSPQITGGGQQGGRRSGTLNVPGIVGMARALELCIDELPTEEERLAGLRDQLFAGLQERLSGVQLCGPTLDERNPAGDRLRLPGNLDVAFGDIDGEAVLIEMDNLAVSSGATCSSHEPGPSHVLLALGLSEDLARSSLRFGLGRFNTPAEVDSAIKSVTSAIEKLRKLAG
ncbi:cysteine desulfurase family protein [Bythopirellula goksoeyrii]|uniref:cysteine desulfurase n=1 Tax=Bythopirellula goksoeyrii TaxID=1400387 RepID=A0A5B9QAC7_9BACT|nr:cysteine desulfurase family protein [Bythopirellula goksoeyrii]QEG34595.1 Cysteine desulfurase [Bythopirellula goksoeyrii]